MYLIACLAEIAIRLRFKEVFASCSNLSNRLNVASYQDSMPTVVVTTSL